MDAPRSPIPRLTAAQRQRRITFSCLGALALVAVIVVAVVNSDSGGDVSAAATASSVDVSATVVTTVPTTTAIAIATTTSPSTTAAPDATVPETTTRAVATTTVAPPTTFAPPTTVAAPPPTSATPLIVGPSTAATNCANAGAISIEAINVLQPILAEVHQFADGLLCGNHRSDGVSEGVDILPGFASLDASADGGDALVGQVPAVIFGHRKSHNRPFYNINKLRAGQIVVIHRLDGSELDLQVATVELRSLADATTLLLSPSVDGAPQVRLVACSHADGTPGGVNYRWIATLVPA